MCQLSIGEEMHKTHKKAYSGYKPELKITGVGQAYIKIEELAKTDEYIRQIDAVSSLREMRTKSKKANP